MSIDGSEGTLRLDGDGRLWLRRFGSNDDIEHTFEWDDHLFGGDCVHLCNRHILSSWLDGQDAETEAAAYIRNQEIENAIYESAETGQYLKL